MMLDGDQLTKEQDKERTRANRRPMMSLTDTLASYDTGLGSALHLGSLFLFFFFHSFVSRDSFKISYIHFFSSLLLVGEQLSQEQRKERRKSRMISLIDAVAGDPGLGEELHLGKFYFFFTLFLYQIFILYIDGHMKKPDSNELKEDPLNNAEESEENINPLSSIPDMMKFEWHGISVTWYVGPKMTRDNIRRFVGNSNCLIIFDESDVNTPFDPMKLFLGKVTDYVLVIKPVLEENGEYSYRLGTFRFF